MRKCLTAFLFVVCPVYLHAQGSSGITLQFDSISLTDLLGHLSEEYDIRFSYSREYIPGNKVLSITTKGNTVDEVLVLISRKADITFDRIGDQIVLTSPQNMSPEYLRIRGRVQDAETFEPLAFASIGLKGRTLGTISNEEGVFDFRVPLPNMEDTLVVAMMGYRRYYRTVRDLSDHDSVTILLKIRPLVLDNVIIWDDRVSGTEIVLQAMERVHENYPMKKHTMQGVFRETYEENGKNVFLVDAVVEISDRGYLLMDRKRDKLRDHVRIENLRASLGNFQSVYRYSYFEFNFLAYALKENIIKYRSPVVSNTWKELDFRLDSVVYFDDRLHFVVSHVYTSPMMEGKDTYFIDAESYAIKKRTYFDMARGGSSLYEWKFPSHPSYQYRVNKRSVTYEFEEYRGKMYLKYIDGDFYADIYNSTNDSVEWVLNTNEMLIITDIKLEKTRIPRRSRMDPDISLNLQSDEYDPAFWENFVVGRMVPLTRKQREDLESFLPLEQQFEQNARLSEQIKALTR